MRHIIVTLSVLLHFSRKKHTPNVPSLRSLSFVHPSRLSRLCSRLPLAATISNSGLLVARQKKERGGGPGFPMPDKPPPQKNLFAFLAFASARKGANK